MTFINCKRKNIITKIVSICFVFLMNIISYSAISNNNGSAFITKAEFDALKSSFQSQIDSYNASIDSKIDDAIASYLAGLNVTKKFETKPYVKGLVWSVSSDYRPRYKYAAPRANEGHNIAIKWDNYVIVSGTYYWGSFDCYDMMISSKKDFDNSTYGQSKLWINNLAKSATSGKSVAA